MLKIGDIVVVRSPTFIGRLIRWVTKSWASHVAVYIGDGFVFEAKPGGAGTKPITAYQINGYQYRIFRLNISLEQREAFVHTLIQKAGEGYDYGQIFSLAVKRLFHLDLKSDNTSLAICSEIIYRSAQEVGISVPPISSRYITPGDFLNWSLTTEIAS